LFNKIEEFLIDLLIPLKSAPILSADQEDLRRLSLKLIKNLHNFLISNLILLIQILHTQSKQLSIDLNSCLKITQLFLTKTILIPNQQIKTSLFQPIELPTKKLIQLNRTPFLMLSDNPSFEKHFQVENTLLLVLLKLHKILLRKNSFIVKPQLGTLIHPKELQTSKLLRASNHPKSHLLQNPLLNLLIIFL
jgi:hypothetical protein